MAPTAPQPEETRVQPPPAREIAVDPEKLMGLAARHNRRQIILVPLLLLSSLLILAIMYGLFIQAIDGVAQLVGSGLDLRVSRTLSLVACLTIYVSGWRRRAAGVGFLDADQSVAGLRLTPETGGAYYVNHQVGKVTGPAYFLSQIFLGGAFALHSAWSRSRSHVPATPEYADRLTQAFRVLSMDRKWHPRADFEPGVARDLHRLGLVLHLARNDSIRAVEHPF